MKFDPFADEPLSPPIPLSPSSQVNRIYHSHSRDYHQQPPAVASSVPGSPSLTPLTIHIPAAAPTEIKRYSTAPSRRIAPNLSSSSDSTSAGTGGGSKFLGGSTIPSAVPALNPSKIVAGILLNRVHAVGKPMRRRLPVVSGPKQYVKSGLSSVVSVEA